MDKDDDGTVSYTEFDEFMVLCDSAFARPVSMRRTESCLASMRHSSPVCRRMSVYRHTSPTKELLERSTASKISYSPRNCPVHNTVGKGSRYLSTRGFSRTRDSASKIRKSKEDLAYANYTSERSHYSPNRSFSKSRYERSIESSMHHHGHSSKQCSLTLDMISYIRAATRLEVMIDRAKQELCLRPDYNSLDNFRLVDLSVRGHVNKNELAGFFYNLDPCFSPEYVFVQ